VPGFAGAGPNVLDFERRQWVRLLEGEYAKAKGLMMDALQESV
jgi:hypothetical protein